MLRVGLTRVVAETIAPVHLNEIGASAGVHLRFDRYGYVVGGVHYGDPGSPVQIDAELRGDRALPDLDAIPAVTSAVGVDLAPVDVTDPEQWRRLEALVWPDNTREAELLAAALGANAPFYWIHAERSTEVVVRLPTGLEVTVAAFGPRIRWLEPRQPTVTGKYGGATM